MECESQKQFIHLRHHQKLLLLLLVKMSAINYHLSRFSIPVTPLCALAKALCNLFIYFFLPPLGHASDSQHAVQLYHNERLLQDPFTVLIKKTFLEKQ